MQFGDEKFHSNNRNLLLVLLFSTLRWKFDESNEFYLTFTWSCILVDQNPIKILSKVFPSDIQIWVGILSDTKTNTIKITSLSLIPEDNTGWKVLLNCFDLQFTFHVNQKHTY